MQIIFAFIFIFLSAEISCCQTIQEHNKCAIEYLNKQDYRGAIEEFTRIIELNPLDSMAYFDRAMAREQLKDYAGALADYSKAIEMDTANPDNYYLRGMVKEKLRDYTGAIADYSKALKIEPGNADAYYFRGLAHAALQDFKSAMDDFTKSIGLNSDHAAEAYGNRGSAKAKLGDTNGAIDDYSKAIGLDKLNPGYYLQRGELRIKSGQKELGCADLNKYKKLGGEPARIKTKMRCN